MADVAQLGIEVRSTGADKAASDLTKLSGAAARAEASVDGLEAATQGASGAASAAAAAYSRQGAAAQSASKQIGMMATAANQNSRGFHAASGNVANLAAQFQDIGVSAAMAMSPMQIALQQGTQISAVLGPMGAAGAVKSLGQAFLSVISPVSLVVIGAVALVAALLQAVNWSQLAASTLNALADILSTIAPYAVAAAAALALLYAPAIIAGLVNVIALLGQLAAAAVTAAVAFAAANPAAAFVLGLVAAVAAMNVFRDELKSIFGRDIVADVKNAANFIIGAFVGAFNGIKAAWSGLPAAIGDAVYQTVNLTIRGVEAMVNKVIDLINNLISGVYDSLSGMAGTLGIDIGSYKGIGKISLGGVDNPFSGAASDAMSAVSKAVSDAQQTDYVGGAYTAIENGASAASAKLKELAKDIVKVDDAKKKSKGGAGGKSDQDKYADIVAGAERQLATLKAEQAAVGLSAEAAAKLKYEQQLLNQAKQADINLTAAQRAELSSYAQEMANVESATARAKEELDFAKSATKGFISDLRSGLIEGKGLWESFGNAAMNVLDKILSKIEDQLVDALFSAGTAAGGGGGILGGLFKIFGFASGGYTGSAARDRAVGVVHGQEYVLNAQATRRIGVSNLDAMNRGASIPRVHSAANQSSSGVHVTSDVNVSIDPKNGSIKAYVEKTSQRQIASSSPKLLRAATSRVVPEMARYQAQNAGGDYRNG